jgi:heterotetrameric sarcosine oxidase gamma subunit
MLKRSSALTSAKPFTSRGLNISEAPDFALTQYAGAEKDLKKALGKIPMRVGLALNHEGRTQLRINPTQIWLIGEPVNTDACISTPLSSSRTRIAVEGEHARAVLAKLSAVDFHPKEFKVDMFVQTAIHHTPALIYCLEENAFHIYAMRTFGLSVWEALTDAALEFAE